MVTAAKTAPDPIAVDEIFRELWYEMGAQLCNFEFYSRHIPRLQDAYGCEAVAAALRQHQAMMRRACLGQIRDLRRNAARLKRERGPR
jgi:hypothetical protein